MAFIQMQPVRKFLPKTSGACSNRLLVREPRRTKTECAVSLARPACGKPAQLCSCHSERSEESQIGSIRAFTSPNQRCFASLNMTRRARRSHRRCRTSRYNSKKRIQTRDDGGLSDAGNAVCDALQRAVSDADRIVCVTQPAVVESGSGTFRVPKSARGNRFR